MPLVTCPFCESDDIDVVDDFKTVVDVCDANADTNG